MQLSNQLRAAASNATILSLTNRPGGTSLPVQIKLGPTPAPAANPSPSPSPSPAVPPGK